MKSKMTTAGKQIGGLMIIAALMITSLTGCLNDKNPAPELPGSSMFIMPYSDFDENSGKTASSNENFVYAATNVAVWNTVIFLNMIVPVAAYWESFNHQADYQGNNTWTWEYNFNSLGIQHSAELQAVLDGNQVHWKMYISKSGNYSNFLWYSGTTQNDRSHAEWTLNHDPTDPKPLVGIEWNRDASGFEDIKYTNVIPGHDDYSGYIYYEQVDDADLDRIYDIYFPSDDNLINIKWHHLNKDGRVKNEARFGDTDWHCWDIDYTDISC